MPETKNPTELYLVIIETSSNQDYIFSTNKLRENIGASELTYRSGTQWVLGAIAAPAGQRGFEVWQNAAQLRQILLDPAKNPPIEESDQAVEILTAASGKALFLTTTQEVAQSIIREVTRRALVEAPGLTIAGVYEKVGTLGRHGALAKAIQKVHRKLETERSHFPSSENRFLRLPIVAECASSSLPASRLVPEGDRERSISQVNHAKWLFALKAKERLAKLDPRLKRQIDQLVDERQKGDQGSGASSANRLLKDDATSDPRSWLGIVHADGNGLGKIFLKFEKYLGSDTSDRNYINTYRKFSLALDECTEVAFKQALEVFPADKKDGAVPVVPLILGGDDLTVVCDGHYALEFTREFLQAFEQQTKAHNSIAPIAKAAFGVDRLSACAGVAIVKRHFPFSVAYSLAAELIRSAKQVKQQLTCPVTDQIPDAPPFPCSALDFHILYDTTGIDLEAIQAKLTPEAQTRLYNRPYIVSKLAQLEEAEGYAWATLHDWETLSQRVQWLKQGKALGDRKDQTTPNTTEEKHPPPLSSSQYHLLRDALFRGKDAADAQYGLIRQRYDLAKFAESENRDSLFHATTDDSDEVFVTSFLDALEAMDFLENAKTNSVQSSEGVNP
ncbi:MAG: hypothetical protein KME20_03725 [Kaiparowitsia implicata GSE-PSE-MK54-09C]|jgi:hypothetical protein|nr:hypothetical protein [Kaiparowitsia implicata GSE-PSE-MK54-09C]